MSNYFVLRLKIAPEDGTIYKFLQNIPKSHRGYEAKKIISDYLAGNGVAIPSLADAIADNANAKDKTKKVARAGALDGLEIF